MYIFASIQLRGNIHSTKQNSLCVHGSHKFSRTDRSERSAKMVSTHGNNGRHGSNGEKGDQAARVGTIRVKQGLAQMLKGGVIVSRFNRIDVFVFVGCELRISSLVFL